MVETFPVLAYVLIHPGTSPSGKSSTSAKEWDELRRYVLFEASRGVKLKGVAGLVGIPWSWRKFRLCVAPFVLREPEPFTDRLIDTWLPDGMEAQQTWVLVLRLISRDPSRSQLEQTIDFDVLMEWMARYAGKREFQHHILKRRNPRRLTRRFWMPIRDWLLAQSDPRHPFHRPRSPHLQAQMPPAKLEEEIQNWQAWVASVRRGDDERWRVECRNAFHRDSTAQEEKAISRPGSIPGMVFRDGSYILRITSPRDLAVEGRALKHCVADYTKEMVRGEKLFFSLRDREDRPQVTIELAAAKEGQAVTIVRASGLRNRQLNPDESHCLQIWRNALNQHNPSRPTYYLEAARTPVHHDQI